MKIIQSILTENPCYKAGKKITVKGLMLHSVGVPQPNASVFIKNWNSANYDRACVHGFIDGNTGDVYQCLPWNHRGWHGGGSSNNTHIGVEMCEPSTIKYTNGASWVDLDPVKTKETVLRTYNSAVELFSFLCEEFSLDPLKDVVSHAEGHKMGIASGHADPEHLWKAFGLSMDGFRQDIKKAMEKKLQEPIKEPIKEPESKPLAYPTIKNGSSGIYVTQLQKLLNQYGFNCGSVNGKFGIRTSSALKKFQKFKGLKVNGICGAKTWDAILNYTYLVRVATSVLRVRRGPGIQYGTITTVKKDEVFTIVDVQNGWGLLKSYQSKRNGWIRLSYTERV